MGVWEDATPVGLLRHQEFAKGSDGNLTQEVMVCGPS